MESHQYIAVCDTVEKKRISIVDISGTNVTFGDNVATLSLTYNAESAIINPVSPVIAIRGRYLYFLILFAE